MPTRQIHMDFHTSPLIPDVGADFDADEFGSTLRNAHVQHVNLFAKCHHGYFYYPTRLGEMHPGLSFDLLGAQTAACRKYGISYSIYNCVGWNERYAELHPDMLELSPDGIPGYLPEHERGFYKWKTLCINSSEYREQIKAELSEQYELFRPLGFWIDIIQPHECVCPSCRKRAAELGLDISLSSDRKRLARLSAIDYMRDIFGYLHSLDPELHVYFNGFAYACDLGDEPELSNANKRSFNTFMDIESLPSQEWGYSHFPISVNYVNKYRSHDVTMMNGKFHLAWGDFGTLRNREALEYECFRALANGAGVCIGDQLHPSGAPDAAVYERIGEVFAMLEAAEPWCVGSEKLAQIGVFPTVRSGDAINNAEDLSLNGVWRVLSELKLQFDILDLSDPLDSYELLILPDTVTLTPEAAVRIDDYVNQGGKLLVTGCSGVVDGSFILSSVPAIYKGQGRTAPRYMDIRPGVFPKVPAMKTVSYSGGASVEATPGAEILCMTVDSYFDRSEEHFCSHRQTPPKPHGDGEPCTVFGNGVAYVSNFIFRDIAEYGVRAYKDIVSALIDRLLPRPLVKSDLPSYAEVTVRRLGSGNTVHVLNYIVQRKCLQLDTVEELVPLYGRSISVYTGSAPVSVREVPSGETVAFEFSDGYTVIKPEVLYGHTMIEIRL